MPESNALQTIYDMSPLTDRERELMALAVKVAYEFAEEQPSAPAEAWVARLVDALKGLSNGEDPFKINPIDH
jgi:alkylhydroperoxidase/carboxymuconolactone decarboxylase family protein YurZ